MVDRTELVRVRMTPDEKEAFCTAAEERNQTMSEFVREAIRRERDRMEDPA